MLISDAQRESRTVYLGGSVGQLVSALVWLVSATVGTLSNPVAGFWTLAFGGATIFPITQAALRLAGRPASLSAGNPLRGLAMQVAFTIPIALPVAAAAALHRPGWFYPACLVIVGAHYLPFVFLYGMRTFAVLAAALVGCGYAIALLAPDEVLLGGWVGGGVLLIFAAGLFIAYRKGNTRSAST
jgi:hypothetical protein